LKSLYLIGGGRWARVVLAEATKLSDQSINLVVISNKNCLFMTEWTRKTFFDRNILVLEQLPDFIDEDSFLYVLNETELRYDTLMKLIKFKRPVLVEKPLGLNYCEAKKMIDEYVSTKVPLMSAQVFRFLESTSNIREILEPYNFHSIRVCWSDPYSETKSGEVKNYEKAVPSFLDVLPHIFSLLEEIVGDFSVSFQSIDFNEIENEFLLSLRIDSLLDLDISYSRIASTRDRYFEFISTSGTIKYDFSKNETITKFEKNHQVYLKEFEKSKSIQLMLTKFLLFKDGEIMDAKFSHATNIRALEVCQEIQTSINLHS
jgi:predicted dehydrogenase